MKYFLFISSLWLSSFMVNHPAIAQQPINSGKTAFQSGEKIVYKVYYNWSSVWVGAGEVTFTVNQQTYRNKPCYYFKGYGATYKSYDWFFKVRDTYESYSDTASLLPFRFKRKVLEGPYSLNNQYLFDHNKDLAYFAKQKYDHPVKIDTLKTGKDVYDVLSIIYYTRNIDYSQYQPNDTIPIKVILDGKVHEIYLRYTGKEEHTTEKLGTFRCITFKPLLIEGTLFEGGEKMKVWVTDDDNRIPILVESPIVVGSVKAMVIEIKGNRHPMTSRIKDDLQK